MENAMHLSAPVPVVSPVAADGILP